MKRREFITLLGGAAGAWPLAARAQQSAMPVIGYLESRSPDGMTDRLRAFRQGLKDTGYVEGENVRIEYRWAENQVDRLPVLAAELVRQRVSVIATTGGPEVALAAKAATMTIPIVFGVTEDPVPYGLVASHSRPGGNATGVNFLITELESKRLGLLHELIPAAARVGLLVNPKSLLTERTMRDVTTASSAIGLQVDVVQASDSREIESVFKTLVQRCVVGRP
jgi:putative ABC transport system substrate-binding protein